MTENNNKVFVFGKKESLCLKGLLCLLVFIHHLYQFTGYFEHTHIGYLLNFLGPWSVSAFLFISGYGLMISVRTKSGYVDSFIKKRFLPLYFEYVFFVVAYGIYDFHYDFSYVKLLITSLTWGKTIVSFGWFFPMIFALYLGFFASFKLKKKFEIKCLCFGIYICIYVVFAKYFGQNVFPVPSFAVGCVMGLVSDETDRLFQKFKYCIMGISAILVLAFVVFVYIFGVVQQRYNIGNLLYDFFLSLSGIFVSIFAYTFTCTCSEKNNKFINNAFFNWLGQYSLEIYCTQGLILRVLYQIISVRVVYFLVAIVTVLLVSVLLNKLFVEARLIMKEGTVGVKMFK